MNLRKIFLMSFFILGMTLFSFNQVRAEKNYDLKEITPTVQAALDGRKSRHHDLRAFKKEGLIGENNHGYVEALGGGGDVRSIVDAENKDRHAIYNAIVEQNHLPSSALSTIEAVFAATHREKAGPGIKIQEADGRWITK